MKQTLKEAAKSRRKFSEANKKILYKNWKVSGLSKSEFCKANQVSISAFCRWCIQLGLSKADSNWVSVKPAEERNEEISLENLQLRIKVSSDLLIEMNLSLEAAVKFIESLTHATTIIR